MTATVSIAQRILAIVEKHAGITYSELRYQLVRRGGDVSAGTFALTIGDLLDAKKIRVRDSVITVRKEESWPSATACASSRRRAARPWTATRRAASSTSGRTRPPGSAEFGAEEITLAPAGTPNDDGGDGILARLVREKAIEREMYEAAAKGGTPPREGAVVAARQALDARNRLAEAA